MLSFLTSTGGKILGGLLLAVMLGGGLTVAITRHDEAVLAKAQVSEDKAIAAAQAAATAHEIAALQAQQVALTSAAQAEATLKEKTHAAPLTQACVSSPAVRALLNGLRSNGSANGAGTKPSGSK